MVSAVAAPAVLELRRQDNSALCQVLLPPPIQSRSTAFQESAVIRPFRACVLAVPLSSLPAAAAYFGLSSNCRCCLFAWIYIYSGRLRNSSQPRRGRSHGVPFSIGDFSEGGPFFPPPPPGCQKSLGMDPACLPALRSGRELLLQEAEKL